MRCQLRDLAWILLAAGVIFLTNLGTASLWDEDEPLYASVAWEMIQRGDWVVPYYNGQMFPDKPPLMFWTMMAGFEMFGRTEFAVRIFSALLGIATVIAVYHLGQRLFDRQTGLLAAMITASTLIFTVSARAATVDSALTFVTVLALLLFAIGGLAKKGSIDKDSTRLTSPNWGCWVAIWCCLGVAVLAKGPIGLLLPAASIGLFLMITSERASLYNPINFLDSLWQMRPVTGIVVVSLVSVPWFVLVGLRDPQWLAQFFGMFNLRPFTQPILGHSGPIWYHFVGVLIGFFPWSVFAVPCMIHLVRQLRGSEQQKASYTFLACWVGLWFVFWSICKTKLPHYVLPAYPALALLTAAFLRGWILEPQIVSRWWLRAAMVCTLLGGIGFLVGFPIAASMFAPGEQWLGLIGLVPLIGGGVCWYLIEYERRNAATTVYAVMSVVLLTAVFGFATLRIDRLQNARPLIAAIQNDTTETPQLAGFCHIRESLVFYSTQTITYCDTPDELAAFLKQSDRPYVFVNDEQEAEIERHFPGQFEVLIRRPRFLHSGEVIVLAHRPGSHTIRTVGTIPNKQR